MTRSGGDVGFRLWFGQGSSSHISFSQDWPWFGAGSFLGVVFEPLGPFSAATGVETSGECSCAALAEPLTLAELVVDVEVGICTSSLLALNRCGRSSGLLRVAMGRFCLALSFGRRSGRLVLRALVQC